jgi:hypothetical protein
MKQMMPNLKDTPIHIHEETKFPIFQCLPLWSLSLADKIM